tara:strand:- start:162 stop:308 length:147 start_codon:yes stop_codon:yes gene_type:complete
MLVSVQPIHCILHLIRATGAEDIEIIRVPVEIGSPLKVDDYRLRELKP